jgi:hypothetical protein
MNKTRHFHQLITHDNKHQGKKARDTTLSSRTTGKYSPFSLTEHRPACRTQKHPGGTPRSATSPHHSTGTPEEAVLMPRRPTKTERDIPLWLIPTIVKREVHTHGEELDWVFVRSTGSHFYNIRIRTRPVKRELRSSWARSRIRENLQGDAVEKGTDDSSGSEQ